MNSNRHRARWWHHAAGLSTLAWLMTMSPVAAAGTKADCNGLRAYKTNYGICLAKFGDYTRCGDIERIDLRAACLATAKNTKSPCSMLEGADEKLCEAFYYNNPAYCTSSGAEREIINYCQAWTTPKLSECDQSPSELRRGCKDAVNAWLAHITPAEAAPVSTDSSTSLSASSGSDPDETEEDEELEEIAYEFADLLEYAESKLDEYQAGDPNDAGWRDEISYTNEQFEEWCKTFDRGFAAYRSAYEDPDPANAMRIGKQICPIVEAIEKANTRAVERAETRDRSLTSALQRQTRPVRADEASIASASGAEKAALVAASRLVKLDIGWRDGGGSDFQTWLSGDSDTIRGGLNCYESVAYAAVAAGLTTKAKLRSFFFDGSQGMSGTPEFRAAFGVDRARPITDVMSAGGLKVGDVLFFDGDPGVHTVLSLGGLDVISVDDASGYRKTTLTELAERYGYIGNITVARNPPLFR